MKLFTKLKIKNFPTEAFYWNSVKISRMNGFFVVNKPQGITSHDVVAFARRRLKIRRIGHAGTLDPMATGVLILGVGSATRLLEYIKDCEKEYEAEITFGATSNTDDAEGEITPFPNAKTIAREEFEKILPEFLGKINQIPPQFSAIKVQGRTAYSLARKGEEVKLKSREVMIHALKLHHFSFPKAEFSVCCGSGTYIRSLARDLGARLEVGAHLSKLARTRVGKFAINHAIPLKSIRAEKLIPADKGVPFPQINLTRVEAEKIRNGQKISARTSELKVAAIFDDNLLAILVKEESQQFLKPEKVFISQSVDSVGFSNRKIT